MYIVFHDRVDRSPNAAGLAKFDDLAKVEADPGANFIGRARTSRTPVLLALKVHGGWRIMHGDQDGAVFRRFWMGNNTEVYAALQAIASGDWAAPACAKIAQDALNGRDGVEAAIERLDSGVFI